MPAVVYFIIYLCITLVHISLTHDCLLCLKGLPVSLNLRNVFLFERRMTCVNIVDKTEIKHQNKGIGRQRYSAGSTLLTPHEWNHRPGSSQTQTAYKHCLIPRLTAVLSVRSDLLIRQSEAVAVCR